MKGPGNYLTVLQEKLSAEGFDSVRTDDGVRVDAEVAERVRRSHESLLSRFMKEGRLVAYPSKKLHRYHVLLHLVGLLKPQTVYLERQVNELAERMG